MDALRTVLAAAVLFTSAQALAQTCENPRVRDISPLTTAIAQDRAMVQAFVAAAQACAQGGDCEKGKADCSTALAATLQAQVNFDEGWWLRDVLLPYNGSTYAPTTPLAPSTPLTDVSCALDLNGLNGAAQRRNAQAERRSTLLNEYPKYAKWANEQYARCKQNSAAEEARATQAKADAERLAAAAAAAKGAEEARKQAEEDKRRKAEDDVKKAREAQEEAAKKQREAIADAKRQQEEAAKKNAEAEARARMNSEEKAKRDAEDRAVAEREGRKEALRKQRSQMISDAENQAQSDEEAAEARRKKLEQQIADEEAASKDAAGKRARDLKRKAEGIAIPDDDERSRGQLSLFGGAGYSSITGSEGTAQGVAAGGGFLGHLGFWGTAPLSGIANGLEIRIGGEYLVLATGGEMKQIRGYGTLRYFLGPLGIGAGGEFRLYDTTLNGVKRSSSMPGFGPALGIQMLDTPHGRVSLNAMWLPLGGSTTDMNRVVGDLEMSREVITVDLIGGLQTDPVSPARSGWLAMALLGVRFGM